MRILALQGSPRSEGNTQALLEAVLEGARQAGAQAESIRLCDLDFKGCMECHGCQQAADRPGCVIEDDMQAVLDKAMKADVVVWATPVFCWSPSWLLKMAMDRFYCTFKFGEDGGIRSLMAGKKMAAVVTAGGSETDGADLVVEICRRMAHFSKAEWCDALVASHLHVPDSIRADAALRERARAFGRRLAI